MTEPIVLTAEDFVDSDYIMVRPALVRKIGDLPGVLLIARIQFRSHLSPPDAEGLKWWKANYDDLARETGMSTDTSRRTVERLFKRGLVLAKIANESSWDRTKSYRVPLRQMHLAVVPDGPGADAKSNQADLPDLLPTKEDLKKEQEQPPRARRTASTFAAVADEHFAEWYDVYPLKKDRPKARSAYVKALEKLAKDQRVTEGVMTAVDILLCAAHAYRGDPGRDPAYTKHPTTWLNQESWDNERTPAPRTPTPAGSTLVERNGMWVTGRNAASLDLLERLKAEEATQTREMAPYGPYETTGGPW